MRVPYNSVVWMVSGYGYRSPKDFYLSKMFIVHSKRDHNSPKHAGKRRTDHLMDDVRYRYMLSGKVGAFFGKDIHFKSDPEFEHIKRNFGNFSHGFKKLSRVHAEYITSKAKPHIAPDLLKDIQP